MADCWETFVLTDLKSGEVPTLHRAAQCRNVMVAKQLIDAGENVDARDENGRTPLMTAIVSIHHHSSSISSKADIIEVLLNGNADIHLRDKEGKSVWQMLHWTHAPIVQLLMKKLSEQYADSKSIAEVLIEADCPLHIGVLTKDFEVVKLMLDHGCPVVDPVTRMSLLSSAFVHIGVDARIVQLILEQGVDVHAYDGPGCAGEPIGWFAKVYRNNEQHLEILKLLLDHGALEFRRSRFTEMAISQLLQKGDRRTISLLFQYLPDLSKQDGDGSTVLHYIVRNTNEGVIEEIRDKHFDVNQIDRQGFAALHYSLGTPEWVEFLLENGADVDAGEMTALYYTFWRDQYICYTPVRSIELLLRHGADPRERHGGRTIFEIPIVHPTFSGEQMMQPVVARLAMLASLGESIDESIFDKISSLKRLYGICKRQIIRMKNHSLDGSVSLFTLFTADDKRFACYVRNRNVMAEIEPIRHSFSANHMNTYYYNILRERITAMKEVLALKEKLASVIFEISGFHYDAHRIIVDGIIQYFSVKELRKFDFIPTD